MTVTISAGSIVLLQPNNVKAHLVGYASNGDAVLETSGGDFESFPPECIEPVTPIEPKKISDEARVLANEILIKLVKDEKVTRIDCETEYLAPLLQSALTAARNKALEDAAALCDRISNSPDFNGKNDRRTCGKCAAEIRAMKVQA